MNIAVAGGTGFIGKVVLQKLIDAGHHVKALIRHGSLLKINRFPNTESRYAYYESPSGMAKNVEDCQAVINLVGIIKETKDTTFDLAFHIIPLSLANAARQTGVKRFIHISALGVDRGIETGYFQNKQLGEKVVMSSGLDWTIFRPALVFGPEDRLFNMLARYVRLAPFFPVIGDGQYKFMPVHINNLADGFVQALNKPETIDKTYDAVGPDTFTFDEMLDVIGQAIGKRHVSKIHQPLWLARLAIQLFGPLLPGPLSIDTMEMLLAGSTSEDDNFFKTFDTTPIHFAEGIREYLKK